MIKTIKKALQNGLIFVEYVKGGQPPDPVTDDKIQNTSSCISIVCLHEIDGEAELILGPAEEVAPGFDLAFDGTIKTPSKELMLSTVLGESLLKMAVPNVTTRIRVWRNHPEWADKVAGVEAKSDLPTRTRRQRPPQTGCMKMVSPCGQSVKAFA